MRTLRLYTPTHHSTDSILYGYVKYVQIYFFCYVIILYFFGARKRTRNRSAYECVSLVKAERIPFLRTQIVFYEVYIKIYFIINWSKHLKIYSSQSYTFLVCKTERIRKSADSVGVNQLRRAFKSRSRFQPRIPKIPNTDQTYERNKLRHMQSFKLCRGHLNYGLNCS